MKLSFLVLASAVLLAAGPTYSQSLSLAEVTATGAKPLTASEAKDVVSGAKTEFTLVNGSFRQWTNSSDGTFTASRSTGDPNRRTARGTWTVNDDSALCLTFDWGAMETEAWCRQLYRVEDRYYAYSLGAKPDTKSGRYRFSK
jgi:hypothetical protein